MCLCILCWLLAPIAQPGTTTTMPQESVSVDLAYTAAVMATRWRLTTVTVPPPQREKVTTGGCPFRHVINNTNRWYSEMPSNASQLDEVMCGPYNRRGFLCGECKEGYGLAPFGLKCANCSSPWSAYAIYLYLLLQFVPTTLMFIGLAMFRLKLTSGPLL
jgi:hypothetical protein